MPLLETRAHNEYSRISSFITSSTDMISQLETSMEEMVSYVTQPGGHSKYELFSLDFAAFTAANIEEMYFLETRTVQALNRFMDESELDALELSMIASVPRQIKIQLSACMMNALNDHDILRWLSLALDGETERFAQEIVHIGRITLGQFRWDAMWRKLTNNG